MSCVKTGCHVFLEPYRMWALGDAFELYGVTYFRFSVLSYNRIRDVKHFTVHDWEHWFDEDKTTTDGISTMICSPFAVINHGHEGVAI